MYNFPKIIIPYYIQDRYVVRADFNKYASVSVSNGFKN